jgi:NDP-sugar pyrophosphorylase family protein
MNALLICPAEHLAVDLLAVDAPLAAVPLLGKSLVEFWVEHAASLGATKVRVLAADRSEMIETRLGDGKRWGVQIEVIPTLHEFSVADARNRYRGDDAAGWLSAPNDVVLMNRLPGQTRPSLCADYAAWFETLMEWLPCAVTPDRIGLREIQPGVWAGMHARIDPAARLVAPCWLGENVHVGPRAIIGPRAILEDKVYVETAAEISHGIVGAATFVGEFTQLKNSIALGGLLINWKNGSSVEVRDPFLLCALSPDFYGVNPAAWWDRTTTFFKRALFSEPPKTRPATIQPLLLNHSKTIPLGIKNENPTPGKYAAYQ